MFECRASLRKISYTDQVSTLISVTFKVICYLSYLRADIVEILCVKQIFVQLVHLELSAVHAGRYAIAAQ